MASATSLSTRDVNVLEKIKDPEFDPNSGVITDLSLPRDPHVIDTSVYERVMAKERQIIQTIQKLEMDFSRSMAEDSNESTAKAYKECAAGFDELISEFPRYASARNNRAQIVRRLYGDAMLLSETTSMPMPLIEQPEKEEKRKAAKTALEDLETSISLLSPATLTTPMSPQAARTLSMAHTQRAAIYLKTSKLMSHRDVDVSTDRKEVGWSKLDFEEAASQDLALGGRYGNQVAKGLAVSVNPTAKLCGQMVREAMKKEYGPSFGDP